MHPISTRTIRTGLALFLAGALVAAGPVAVDPATAHGPGPHGPGVLGPKQGPGPFADPHRYEDKELIVLFGLGRAENKSTQPNAFDVTVPLVSPETGKVIGTSYHRPKCVSDGVPCLVVLDEDTYEIPGGTIVARGRVSLPPDPDNPGFNIVGGQPDENNIVSATGRYAGRTGKVRAYGYIDTREFPKAFVIDEIYVIALDPVP